jgi:hypothetical protein
MQETCPQMVCPILFLNFILILEEYVLCKIIFLMASTSLWVLLVQEQMNSRAHNLDNCFVSQQDMQGVV